MPSKTLEYFELTSFGEADVISGVNKLESKVKEKKLIIYFRNHFPDVNLSLATTNLSLCKISKFHLISWCRNAQFSQSFGRIAQNSTETLRFHKNSTPGNQVKLRYFMQPITLIKLFFSQYSLIFSSNSRILESIEIEENSSVIRQKGDS